MHSLAARGLAYCELSDHSGMNLTYLVVEIQPRCLVFLVVGLFWWDLRGSFFSEKRRREDESHTG